MFNKSGLIGITVGSLKDILENTLNGEFLSFEVGEDEFRLNIGYSDDETLLKDMELMGIEDDSNCFIEDRIYDEYEKELRLSMSLRDVSKIINDVSNEVLSSSLQYFYDGETEYIQFITE